MEATETPYSITVPLDAAAQAALDEYASSRGYTPERAALVLITSGLLLRCLAREGPEDGPLPPVELHIVGRRA